MRAEEKGRRTFLRYDSDRADRDPGGSARDRNSKHTRAFEVSHGSAARTHIYVNTCSRGPRSRALPRLITACADSSDICFPRGDRQGRLNGPGPIDRPSPAPIYTERPLCDSPVALRELRAALGAGKALGGKDRAARPRDEFGRGYRLATSCAGTCAPEHPATERQ